MQPSFPTKINGLIAGPGAAKVPESGSKRLPARIWRKTAVSAHFHTSSLIAGPGAAKVPESGSKRLPAPSRPGFGAKRPFRLISILAV